MLTIYQGLQTRDVALEGYHSRLVFLQTHQGLRLEQTNSRSPIAAAPSMTLLMLFNAPFRPQMRRAMRVPEKDPKGSVILSENFDIPQ